MEDKHTVYLSKSFHGYDQKSIKQSNVFSLALDVTSNGSANMSQTDEDSEDLSLDSVNDKEEPQSPIGGTEDNKDKEQAEAEGTDEGEEKERDNEDKEPPDKSSEEENEELEKVQSEERLIEVVKTSADEAVEEEEEEEPEQHVEEEEVEQEEPAFYNPDDFISGPRRCKEGTLPMNILEFEYPFLLELFYYEMPPWNILTLNLYLCLYFLYANNCVNTKTNKILLTCNFQNNSFFIGPLLSP